MQKIHLRVRIAGRNALREGESLGVVGKKIVAEDAGHGKQPVGIDIGRMQDPVAVGALDAKLICKPAHAAVLLNQLGMYSLPYMQRFRSHSEFGYLVKHKKGIV